jgi:hypothetical protein
MLAFSKVTSVWVLQGCVADLRAGRGQDVSMTYDQTELIGYVDGVAGNQIMGWAKCGNGSCEVDLLIDGTFVSTTASDRFRADLLGEISFDGKRAFIIFVPPVYCDGTTKAIDVCFTGTDTTLKFGRFQFSQVFSYQPAIIVAKPDPKLGLRAKVILSLLRPSDVTGGTLVRRGRVNDGGYVMLDSGLENTIGYSLGISDDVSWDLEMAKVGCHLYQYDHTIEALPMDHPNFHWSRNGIASTSSPDGMFKSIGDLIRANGHDQRCDLILKMDIEGFEWDVLQALPREFLIQFAQIVAEFHCFTTIDEDGGYGKITGALQKLNETHQLIHVHANNCGHLGLIGGVPLPDAFEVTYVRIADHQFEECRRVFPTPLDMPCSPDAADFYLGPMGQNADVSLDEKPYTSGRSSYL